MKTLRRNILSVLGVFAITTSAMAPSCKMDAQEISKIADIAKNTYIVVRKTQEVLSTISAGSGSAEVAKKTESIKDALGAVELALETVGTLTGQTVSAPVSAQSVGTNDLDEATKKLKESLKR